LAYHFTISNNTQIEPQKAAKQQKTFKPVASNVHKEVLPTGTRRGAYEKASPFQTSKKSK
jgi:hypothetical protein